jgi:predicted RND superfamily exporter protein
MAITEAGMSIFALGLILVLGVAVILLVVLLLIPLFVKSNEVKLDDKPKGKSEK